MAISPQSRYPGNVNPGDANYPHGSARDVTAPGDDTGTPWQQDLINDILGFQQALLTEGSVTPSGTPDTAIASQYLEALKNLFVRSAGLLPNVQAMKDATFLKTGDFVRFLGYTTPGDGGGNDAEIGSGFGTADNGSVFDLPGSGLQAKGLFVDRKYDLRQWGVIASVNDGTTPVGDFSSEIQAAHDYVSSVTGGGRIDMPPGAIPFAQTLFFGEGEPVLFVGAGRGGIENSKLNYRASAGTRIIWTGVAGGDGIILTADRNDTGTARRKFGGGIVDAMLDGGEDGGRGLQVVTHSGHVLKIMLCYWTELPFLSTCLSNGVTGGPSDNQGFIWNIHTGDVNTTSEPDTHVVLNGVGSANTSLALIEELRVLPESSAVAIRFGDCDGTLIESCIAGSRVAPSGDGGRVIFEADDTLPPALDAPAGHSRYLNIAFCQFARGTISRAAIGGSNSAGPNFIHGFSKGNAAPDPVIESGSELWFTTDSGLNKEKGVVQAAIGDTDTSTGTARTNITSESLRIKNTASNHVVIESGDGNSVWSITIDNSSGDLRVLRSAGGGNVILDQPLSLIGQTSSTTATAGGASALPATPQGYLEVTINGVARKIPFYQT